MRLAYSIPDQFKWCSAAAANVAFVVSVIVDVVLYRGCVASRACTSVWLGTCFCHGWVGGKREVHALFVSLLINQLFSHTFRGFGFFFFNKALESTIAAHATTCSSPSPSPKKNSDMARVFSPYCLEYLPHLVKKAPKLNALSIAVFIVM